MMQRPVTKVTVSVDIEPVREAGLFTSQVWKAAATANRNLVVKSAQQMDHFLILVTVPVPGRAERRGD
jgi:hypothetical protein